MKTMLNFLFVLILASTVGILKAAPSDLDKTSIEKEKVNNLRLSHLKNDSESLARATKTLVKAVGVIGAQSSDIVLLFKDKNDILGIDEVEITLGSDISVAAGPENKGSSATTNIEFDSQIYSYCYSKGLFAGVSLKGGVLSYSEKVNDAFYGKAWVDIDEIFNEIEAPFNDQVYELIHAINIYSE